MTTSGKWVYCEAGKFTRIYQGMSLSGWATFWAQGTPPPASVHYREYSASPPFYFEDGFSISVKHQQFVGPTPYLELHLNPSRSGFFRVT